MKKQLVISWMILIVLTGIVSILSILGIIEDWVIITILTLSLTKFLGVSFYFMEMKASNSFWKVTLILFVVLFFISAVIIL